MSHVNRRVPSSKSFSGLDMLAQLALYAGVCFI
jgi:hypothetical protein